MNKASIVLAASGLTRYILFNGFPSLPIVLDSRAEVTTPVTSYKRCVFQYSHHVSPYDGGVFHQSPLLLALFSTIQDLVGNKLWAINWLYIALDLTAILALYRIAAWIQRKQPLDSYSPWIVACVYAFNPLTLMCTLSRSTLVFTNTLIILAVSSAVRGRPIQAVAALALASCLSVYPLYLAPPLILLAYNETPKQLYKSYTTLGSSFFILIAAFLTASYLTAGSWDFLQSTYGVILLFTELTPNLGLWWYFFTEMFDFFRPFFICVFQIYVAIFSFPLTLRLKNHPIFVLTTIIGISTLFRTYPEVGDVGLYFSLLALFRPIYPLTLALLYSAVLAPTFLHLWIYLGSGNSNFFYAITLVYALGISIALSDSLWTVIRLDYDGAKASVSQI